MTDSDFFEMNSFRSGALKNMPGFQELLEDAYRLLQSGSGPQYPTVAVEGGEVSLRNMQEISATGVTRPVIRE